MTTSKTRMGRPPKGIGGTKVQDYPRFTLRLEPRVLKALKAAAKREGKPAWNLVNESLIAYLDLRMDDEPGPALPTDEHTRQRPEPVAKTLDEDRRAVTLTYSQCRALHAAALADDSDLQGPSNKLLDRCGIPSRSNVFKDGYPEQKDPTTADPLRPEWTGEIDLAHSRHLRALIYRTLRRAAARTEQRIRSTKRMQEKQADTDRAKGLGPRPRSDEQIAMREAKWIRKENGHLRRALSALPAK